MVPRRLVSPLAILLVAVGLGVTAVGVIYLVVTAAHLPGFLPGRLVVPTHAVKNGRFIHTHTESKRGVVALCAAGLVFSAAWFLKFRYEPMD